MEMVPRWGAVTPSGRRRDLHPHLPYPNVRRLLKRIGPYPAGFLTDTPKQGTRMHKCECSGCGYIARVSPKWIAAGRLFARAANVPWCATMKGYSDDE